MSTVAIYLGTDLAELVYIVDEFQNWLFAFHQKSYWRFDIFNGRNLIF